LVKKQKGRDLFSSKKTAKKLKEGQNLLGIRGRIEEISRKKKKRKKKKIK